MIAAGSLFTSCIEQVEPEGIRDMRIAKAEFIRSLKDVNAADAEFRRAEAEVERAKSRLIDAKAATEAERANNQKMLNELQALLNEYQALENEQKAAEVAQKIAELEKEMKKAQHQAELDEIDHQREIAEAQKELDKALRDLEFAANDLTDNEKKALIAAAGAYYATGEALAVKKAEVAAYQTLIDSLNAAKAALTEAASMKWDKESLKYVNYVEYFENLIAAEKAKIAEYEAKLAAAPDPTIENIDKWAEEVKAYEDSVKQIKLALANVEKEAAAYFGSTVHEGVKKYNDAIKIWKKEHPEFGDEFTLTPATDFDLAWYANEPKEEDYTKEYAFSVEPLKNLGTATYARFAYMLKDGNAKDYFININDAEISINENAKISYKKPINGHDYPYEDFISTYYFKDFILGDETAEPKTVDTLYVQNRETGKYKKYTYNVTYHLPFESPEDTLILNSHMETAYGLKGALSVLNRSLVTKEESKASQEDLDEALEAAEAKWVAYRETLVAGLKDYAPYKAAIEKNEDAYKAKKDAENADAENAAAVGAAIENLIDVLNQLKEDDATLQQVFDITRASDAKALFDAVANFVEKRAALDYTAPDAEEGVYNNKDLFYFAPTKKANVAVVESVLFTELDEDMALVKNDTEEGTYSDYAWATDGEIIKSTGDKAKEDGVYAGLASIFIQLFNSQTFAKIEANINKALYDLYTYQEKSEDGKTAATIKDYTSKATKDANDKIEGAGEKGKTGYVYGTKVAVADSIKAYLNVYNTFWGLEDGENFVTYNKTIEDAVDEYFNNIGKTNEASKKAALEVAVDGDKDKAGELKFKASCYDEKTFTDPYYMVFFNGEEVIPTNALLAVLNSLDPICAGKGFAEINVAESAILNSNGLFYKWMYAYSEANVGATAQDIAAIEEWVKKVEDAFEAAEKVAAEPDADYYAKAKEMYDDAVNAVENYETMLADWTAFVGEDYEEDGEMVHRVIKSMDNEMTVNNWMDNVQYIEKVIDGVYTGAWDTTENGISGQLLKNAQEFLPNLPENVKAWYGVKNEAEDQINHIEQLQKAAENVFIAAAKLAGYDEDVKKKGEEAAETWDALMKDYKDAQEAYVNNLKADIDQAQKDAEKYADELAKFYEEPSEMGTINNRIYEATIALQQAQMMIDPLTKAKELAKANYDKVMDYLGKVDFTFVDFSNIFDLVDEMFPGVGNDILGKLKSLLYSFI